MMRAPMGMQLRLTRLWSSGARSGFVADSAAPLRPECAPLSFQKSVPGD